MSRIAKNYWKNNSGKFQPIDSLFESQAWNKILRLKLEKEPQP